MNNVDKVCDEMTAYLVIAIPKPSSKLKAKLGMALLSV